MDGATLHQPIRTVGINRKGFVVVGQSRGFVGRLLGVERGERRFVALGHQHQFQSLAKYVDEEMRVTELIAKNGDCLSETLFGLIEFVLFLRESKPMSKAPKPCSDDGRHEFGDSKPAIARANCSALAALPGVAMASPACRMQDRRQLRPLVVPACHRVGFLVRRLLPRDIAFVAHRTRPNELSASVVAQFSTPNLS